MNHLFKSALTRCAALSFTSLVLTYASAQNLPESVHKVLERYPAVGASMARIEAAQADIQRAKGAHWPQFAWSGTYSQYHESTLVNHWIQSPTVNLNLWSGLKIQSDVERAQATTQARREQYRMTRDDISLLATESYLGWALQKNLVSLAMANLATHQKILSDYQTIVQIDPGRRIDMNQAQVRHDNANLSLIQRQSDLKNAELRLKRLLLDDLPAEPGGLDDLKDVVPASVTDALDSLNKDHPVMANWKAQLDAARAGVVNARSQYSPTAQVSYGRQTYPGIAQGVYVSQFILNVPIWDGGSTTGAVKTAQANLDAIEFSLDESRLVLTEKIHSVWTEWKSSIDRHQLSQVQISTGKNLVEGYWLQFKVGRRTLLDLLNVQSDLYNYQINDAMALHEIRVGQARLLAAMGRLALTFDRTARSADKSAHYSVEQVLGQP
jgi:adhesin transport system outer membrane protein